MSKRQAIRPDRRGSVYIAVLGTSLIVSLLALSAVMTQRIQSKIIATSADISQAQLNANTAVELALLTMKQNSNWRTTQPNGQWFITRAAGSGSCSVEVADPWDSNLANNAEDPVVIRGVGYRNQAEQRFETYVDTRRQPADVLRAAANAGGLIAGQSTLDWSSIVSAYSTSGTAINYNGLPTADQFEFGRNTSLNTTLEHWDADPPGLPASTFGGPVSFSGRSACLRVDRSDARAGAGNRLQPGLIKPSTSYQVSVEIHPNLSSLQLQTNRFKIFIIAEFANNTYVESTSFTSFISWLGSVWTTFSGTVTTPAWTQEPTNVYLVINSDGGNNYRFYVDNLHVNEDVSGRLLYGQALGPTATNPNGIYRIDCGGGKLVIERSRILGTLVVLNPGSGSCISNGPMLMAPAVPGYPSLLVNGNFAIRASNRNLSEAESGVNFNPDGMPYDFNTTLASSTDTNANDIYLSEIQGLVAISGDLQFANQPRLRGLYVVGGATGGTYSLTSDPDALITPPPPLGGFFSYRYERRPASGRKVVLP